MTTQESIYEIVSNHGETLSRGTHMECLAALNEQWIKKYELTSDNIVEVKLNSVDSSRFLDWYFSDEGDFLSWARNLAEELYCSGKVSTSVQAIFDSCGYIPQYICNDLDGDAEYTPNQIELILNK